ncbi:MAG: PIN domain-containing protein [Methanobacteriaceae archaeon]|nr:PIN domain-containing protein [Methanobacteriaceae archaeon]
MISEKIALVLDTNILYRQCKAEENMDSLSIEPYDKAIDMIEINDLVEKVNIFIPEIVLMELSNHKLDKMRKRINNIHKFSREFDNIPEIDISIQEDFNIKKQIAEIKELAFDEINIINTPENKEELFSIILEMAMDKIPPFEKGKSDRGFKDAIILLSIIDFAKKSDFTLFILFTDDDGFNKNKKDIQILFNNQSSKKLDIIKSKDIQGYLSEIYDLFIDFKKYLNDVFYPKLNEEINEVNSIVIEEKGVVCNVESFDINKEKTTINQINENLFELVVAFNLTYNCKDGSIELIDDVYRDYVFENAIDGWIITENDFNYRFF